MGVVCYVLLVGYPPFYDEDQKKLFKKIKEGRYHFHADYWGSISPAATDMIRKMLCVNQSERWSAKQLLEHTWIVTDDDELLAKDLTKSILAMRKFKAKMRFKAAAKAIIATKRMMKGMAKTLQTTQTNTTTNTKVTSNLCQLPAIEMQEKMSRRLVSSTLNTSTHLPHTLPSIHTHTHTHKHDKAIEHEHDQDLLSTRTPRPEFSEKNTGRRRKNDDITFEEDEEDKEEENKEGEGEERGRGREEKEARKEKDSKRVNNKLHEKICNDQISRMREKEKEREMEKERKKNSERRKENIVDRKKEKNNREGGGGGGGGDKDKNKNSERIKEREREEMILHDLYYNKKNIQLENSIRIKEDFILSYRSPVSISTTMTMSVPESVEGSAPGTPRSMVLPSHLLSLPILSNSSQNTNLNLNSNLYLNSNHNSNLNLSEKFIPLFQKEENNSSSKILINSS